MRHILLSLLFISSLFAYVDSDFDGVEDIYDKCPNSSALDIVDITGCSPKAKKAKVQAHHYDVVIGTSYSQIDYNTNEKTDTYTNSFQVDYFYKNFSYQLSTSYYSAQSATTENKGLNDTVLAAYYLLKPSDKLNIRFGGGVILPTYSTDLNNNNLDVLASINLSYSLDQITLFTGVNYNIINDDDVAGVVSYQNSAAFSFGAGHHLNNKIYLSSSYYQASSVYTGFDDIKNISAYGFYSINNNWFTTLNYAYGLSDTTSDHSASLRLGYYF